MKQPRTRIPTRNALIDFWFCLQSFLRVRRNLAKAEGLNTREYELLLMLRAHMNRRSVNVALIAERLFVHHHVAAGMVKRLTRKGLVTAERSETDRRSLSLRLTPAGKTLVERIVLRSVQGLGEEGPRILCSLGEILRDKHRPMARQDRF